MVCECTLASFGYGAIAWLLYRLATCVFAIIYPFFVGEKKDLHALAAGADWAVVTGSTDGIGKGYAKQLAKEGFNVLLVSRTPEKLQAVKEELQKLYPKVTFDTFAFNFLTGSREDYQPLIEKLEGLKVGVLINNVGMSFKHPDAMHELGIPILGDITVVNSLPPVVLTAAVLPQMTARKGGIVVNISSVSAYNAWYYWTAYSATKRFVLHLTSILRQEYASKGITFQAVAPGLVSTNMTSKFTEGFFVPGPDTFATSAVRSIGIVGETTGFYAHQIEKEILMSIPEFIREKLLTRLSHTLKARYHWAMELRAKEAKAKAQ